MQVEMTLIANGVAQGYIKMTFGAHGRISLSQQCLLLFFADAEQVEYVQHTL
jgi:hypothetical protein